MSPRALMRKSAGHSLVVAWALWRALAMAPGQPHDSETVVQSYDAKDECVRVARTKQHVRNLILRQYKGETQAVLEVFQCLPSGAPPEEARFE